VSFRLWENPPREPGVRERTDPFGEHLSQPDEVLRDMRRVLGRAANDRGEASGAQLTGDAALRDASALLP